MLAMYFADLNLDRLLNTLVPALAAEAVYLIGSRANGAAVIIPCRRASFEHTKDLVGTLSYEAAHRGRLVCGDKVARARLAR